MAKHDRPGRNEQTVFGVAWFDREQWRHLEQVVANRIELDDTFEQWEQSALKALRKFEAEGLLVERVPVQVDALVTWCRSEGLPIDGPSRAKYVAHVLKERGTK